VTDPAAERNRLLDAKRSSKLLEAVLFGPVADDYKMGQTIP